MNGSRPTRQLRWSRVAVIAALLATTGGLLLASPFLVDRLRPTPVAPKPESIPGGLFVGVDPAKLTPVQRRIFQQAAVDFDRVRRGMAPTCLDEPSSYVADGGTTIYECPYYKLVDMRSMTTVHGVPGFLVGPVLKFDEYAEVSDVRFVSDDEMQRRRYTEASR
jgi:hypothetical protein